MTLADKISGYPLTSRPDDLFEFGMWLHSEWLDGNATYDHDTRTLVLCCGGVGEMIDAIVELEARNFWRQCWHQSYVTGMHVFKLPHIQDKEVDDEVVWQLRRGLGFAPTEPTEATAG